MDKKCRKVMGSVKEDVNDDATGDALAGPLVTVELRSVLSSGTVVSFMNTSTDSDGKLDFH